MKLRLVSNDLWSPPLPFTLDQFPLVIGRNGKSDIAIDDRWVSAQHCELKSSKGTILVRDLESTHGTLVNGQPVAQSVLEPGDNLTIGIRTFSVSYRRRRKRSQATDNTKAMKDATC